MVDCLYRNLAHGEHPDERPEGWSASAFAAKSERNVGVLIVGFGIRPRHVDRSC
jgi:hypothetical protein